MRELLFRGKRIDNGAWVEGFYVSTRDIVSEEILHIIVRNPADSCGCEIWDFEAVDPSTVGQYTGLTDKNGKKIFEGDVIQNVNGYVFGDQYKAVVKMGDKNDGCYIGGYFGEGSLVDIDAYDFKKCEVIGNAIDNPDLLEAEE